MSAPIAYTDLLSQKLRPASPTGFRVDQADLHEKLFPFQRAVVAWGCRQGSSAFLEDCGLGKSLQQLEWARQVIKHAGGRVLIYAPLTVAKQTMAEAAKIDLAVTLARDAADMIEPGIYVTNYDRFHRFANVELTGIVLDESSILKSLDGKTRTALIANYQSVPYRLCCTATPAPNDIAEIANHAEFLGIKTRTEMLATFFVHDQDGWRLKKHATHDFYRWLASWAVYLRKPSDLGFSDEGYELPTLTVSEAVVPCELVPEGHLFSGTLNAGIVGRSEVRKATLDARVARTVELVMEEPDEQWILWCGLNSESDALLDQLGDQAVNVEGKDSEDLKEDKLERFLSGRARILITKPRIAGFGLNLQCCARQAFVGLGDSWEAYYQCLRRSWRFGQTRPVHAWIVVSDAETNVLQNVMRKEEEAKIMGDLILANMGELERANLMEAGVPEVPPGILDRAEGPGWTLHHGDCVEVLREKVASESVHLSVYSPPFATLYTYSDNPRDMGNSRSYDEFFQQFEHFIREMLRVTRPGRLTCVHVAQIPTTLQNDGEIGLFDFRGDCIRAYKSAGWIHHREVCIDKCPQSQAIRTHSKALLFTQMKKDRSWSGPALADYILVFRKPGENTVPVKDGLSNDEWIEWARPIWYGIRESDTLNAAEGRAAKDERHICPLQLGVIERCVRLWSNPGETVLSPFAGIGSEGYQSLLCGRNFIGAELKPEYYRTAIGNLKRAAHEFNQDTFFTA